MNESKRRLLLAGGSLAGSAITAALPGTAYARAVSPSPAYPARPIRLIVPFSRGGSTDIVARIMAPALSRVMGVNVVVDNVSGAGGTAGAHALAAAPADGYSLGMATVSTTGTGPIVRNTINYDPLVDFDPIIKLVDVPGVISVNPGFPASSYDEFIRVVRANPGKYTYASSGLGGVQHMGMELFKIRTATYLLHLPYRGAGPALKDVVAGKIDAMWDNLSSSLPLIKKGLLRPIGLVSGARSEQLPDLPVFAELGVKNYHAATYFGVLAPGGTPALIKATLNAAMNLAIDEPGVRAALINAGGVPVGGQPKLLKRQIINELGKWSEVARYTKVRI